MSNLQRDDEEWAATEGHNQPDYANPAGAAVGQELARPRSSRWDVDAEMAGSGQMSAGQMGGAQAGWGDGPMYHAPQYQEEGFMPHHALPDLSRPPPGDQTLKI